MKKITFIIAVFALSFTVNAQIETPQPSPFSKMEQKVGLTDVTIEYSRPGVKGRTIFGDLVPYDKLWRTGANKNTTISFSDDVTVDGQSLKAGSYAIFTKPKVDSWDIIFYSDTNNWGTPQNWDESKVAAKINAKSYTTSYNMETFTIGLGNLTNSSATLNFIWEKTIVPVEIKVPTDTKVSASIASTMNGPSANDYFSAAVYYLQEGKDINQAKEWIDKAISMSEKPPFWQYRQQSLIYAKSGDKAGAIKAAKKSLEGAKEAGNDDYIKLNTDSLKEWGSL